MILPPDATYDEFCAYTVALRGPVGDDELMDLWEWRKKLSSIRIVTGRGYRERACPPDEHHLTMREREKKVVAEAEAAGITVERAPA